MAAKKRIAKSQKPKQSQKKSKVPASLFPEIDAQFDPILDQLDPKEDRAAMAVIDALRVVAYQIDELGRQIGEIYEESQRVSDIANDAEASREALQEIAALMRPPKQATGKPRVY